ncbi:uncharacterized protein FIESC28_04085 [Fusarium coffeatum]|uniref:Uncharacterized protein n=1 Tax=Fusarium coffeatum TaxID=231269 RepID=A0A366S350_9HYPO|nr:uncharacterized protein FIESC28_04085 [Fusarium coffeatum]RBR23090.1 hypothetical protein FIESC28_04085 [Fusarium coffeatum]
MSSKRPRTDETPDDVDAVPSVERFLRQQHQELLDAFTRLEAHKNRVVAESEKEINDLKRQNQELRSEVESLRTANSSPPAAVSQEPNHVARHFDEIAKVALRLNLRTQNIPPSSREIEVLSRIIFDAHRLSNLEHFMQKAGSINNRCRYCVDMISERPIADASSPVGWIRKKGPSCLFHADDDPCVWIVKRGADWVVGRGRG